MIIQSLALMMFNLIYSILNSLHPLINPVKTCIHGPHTFLDVCILPQIWVNILVWWGIAGWGWPPWTYSCANLMSLSSSLSVWSGLSSCQTPLTRNIFNFLILFSQSNDSILALLLHHLTSPSHTPTWSMLSKCHTIEACCYPNISACVAWCNETNNQYIIFHAPQYENIFIK